MDECDPVPARSLSGQFVDQLVPGAAAGVEGGVEVGDPIADVVDAGPAPCQEATHRRIGPERLQQFHLALAEGQGHDGGTVGHCRRAGLESEHVAIERDRGGKVRHGDSDMGDARELGHGRGV